MACSSRGCWEPAASHRAWGLPALGSARGALPNLAVVSPCGWNKEMEQGVVVVRRQCSPRGLGYTRMEEAN